jgi:hypothetical protein
MAMKIVTPRTLAKRYARCARNAAQSFIAGAANPRSGEPRDLKRAARKYAAAIERRKGAYARGFAPYREILARLELPPRGEKGSNANWERVRIVCEALHNEKLRRASLHVAR